MYSIDGLRGDAIPIAILNDRGVNCDDITPPDVIPITSAVEYILGCVARIIPPDPASVSAYVGMRFVTIAPPRNSTPGSYVDALLNSPYSKRTFGEDIARPPSNTVRASEGDWYGV